MPIYEYKCSKCSHKYDKREGFEASPVQKCPECGGKAQRVIHAPPIVFKGSGFYITDSRTSASAAASETKSESKAESKDSKSDSTSDEKTSVAKPKDTKTDSASPAAETPAAG
jgi:putative FmdB family regulatory protein